MKLTRDEVSEYLAKWFDKGRDYGQKPITKDMLKELETESAKILEACEREAQEKVREILDSLISENRRLSVELQKDRIERPIDYEGYKALRSKKKSIQFAISIVKKHLGGE